MSVLSRFIGQSFRIPAPPLTEKNLPDQTGRVVVVTGGYAGVGYELTKILYQRNATVYVAGRSPKKAAERIAEIEKAVLGSKGRLEFLQLDLGDLRTIKGSAEAFSGKEERLDVLINNAGVMNVPAGSTTPQTHELQLGTNCLGPFLFTQLLTPLLKSTADSSPPGSVRVSWAGSLGIDVQSHNPGGIEMNSTTHEPVTTDSKGKPKDPMRNYGQSKVGNLFLASQYAVHHPISPETGKGVISNAFNPGNLKTELQRQMRGIMMALISLFMLFPAVFGAYTELFAGWSEEMGRRERNGGYVVPWGRAGDVRGDIQKEVEMGVKGGEGRAVEFWEWCDRETREFM
ncbi:short-chain alcohol dehydrogenase [Recurvomyces mirabilis]|uniref:Short-chain alcohol dehydrogenase n=1 Tax=Recurvomyces mirabilis TaxID=574656 RepID=A0AAE1BZD5_9PEZI|nr:short-chain alcohol dehydrogenase [Recurvomyces mirabilis]KAK5153122.1 short-chain alcohol dehydrogenase [Recurvomyces mirabilis]